MPRYGKKASEKVEKAMHERKQGTLKKRPLGQEGYKQETGDRDRTFRGSRGRRQGAGEEGLEEALFEEALTTDYTDPF